MPVTASLGIHEMAVADRSSRMGSRLATDPSGEDGCVTHTERAPLPSGTVTLLFSDIEGSTRMLAELGDAYADVLAGQRQVLRAAFAAWNGTELGTEGDSFFVAFTSARDAVAACVDAQRGLAERSWPGGAEVAVRMGLHTGEPQPYEDGYVGMDVHLAARVAGTAHGGQVVLSESTSRLAADHMPADVRLIDLGVHRLKDIDQPQRLHQLTVSGLRTDFPALRSLGASSNLPVTRTELVGRSREAAEVVDLLTNPTRRLVTITGLGGSGKTRLAVAIADAASGSFRDGVYFVRLASVTDPAVVWTSVAEALGLPGDILTPASLSQQVAGRRLLLVLDNLEQLGDAGGSVVARLVAVDGPTVLATSRRPLRVLGEQEYPLDTLDLPPTGNVTVPVAAAASAVALFVQRARLVKPGFTLTEANVADVVALCRQLDGLPLALELAASRTRLLSPRALVERVDSSLTLADTAAGRPDRHRTLDATMRWSYELLTPLQQETFRRLSVFAGGGGLEAVGAVTGVSDPLDDVAELVEASLVRLDEDADGSPRVRLLQTVRRFATDRAAEAGDLDDARRRHAEHFATVAENADARIRGPDGVRARAELVGELDNLRQALTWGLAVPGSEPPPSARVEVGVRICRALGWFWYAGGYLREGRSWLERASALASDEQEPELAGLQHTLGILLTQQGRHGQARDLFERNLAIRRRLGDPAPIAVELNSLGVVYRSLGAPDRARAALDESISLARDIDDPKRLASALSNLGMLEMDESHTERAVELLTEARECDRARGDRWGVAADDLNLSTAYLLSGRADEARARLGDVADEAHELGDLDLTLSLLELLAVCAATRGDLDGAARVIGATDGLREREDLPRTDPDQVLLARLLAPWLNDADEAAWDSAATAGRGLTETQALDLALGRS